MLERTELYFVPKKTIGKVRIQVSRNRIITVDSEQEIRIIMYVDSTTNRDFRLKANLEATIREELIRWLNSNRLSISVITKTLVRVLGDNIFGIKLSWGNELEELDTFAILDSSESINIKQRLILNFDDTLEIRDSVLFNYVEQGI